MAICSTYGHRLAFVLLFLTIFFIIGIYVFTQGFLLNRLVVPKWSSCNDSLDNISSVLPHELNTDPCWMSARFKRAVIIVIDALRHDFMVYNESLADQDAHSYQNKLKVIHEVLKRKPGHGKVFKFIADPPTTTMQRVKGLTTGSLPTFIDAGSNFASSEILEDNIIFQFKSLGKKLVFMGDDTWMGLFPDSFQRHYPFPSFNVKDLHTVDNGILLHLVPEVRRNDWDIIIAHFLGVDHCGHRYGPYHSEMAKKLLQMDEVIRSVINELDNETILLVFGDHGMTKTGDHGGDSLDELHAGLFVYSSTKIFALSQGNEEFEVSQTDIVPTISLLLGTPIPFANLGIVITSLFEDTKQNDETKKRLDLLALQLNARQVHRYLAHYSKLSNDISSSALKKLTKLFSEAEQHFLGYIQNITSEETLETYENLTSAKKKYLDYLRGVRELCNSVWARFDLPAIMLGISVVCFSCSANILTVMIPKTFLNEQFFPPLTRYNMFGSLVAVFLLGFLLRFGFVFTSVAGCFVLGFVLVIVKYYEILLNLIKDILHSWNLAGFTVTLVLSLYFVSFFSNSFVVHEDKVVLFFLQTMLFICFVDILKNFHITSKFSEFSNLETTSKKLRKKDNKKLGTGLLVFRKTRSKQFLLLVLLVLGRLGQLFWPCREEQFPCESSSFVETSTVTLSNELEPGHKFWMSCVLLWLIPSLLLLWLRSCGNLNNRSCTVLLTKYALPLASLFVCIHWFLQFVPAKVLIHTPAIGFLQQILTPCIAYLCSILTLLYLIIKPLTIYLVAARDSQAETADSTSRRPTANTIVEIFNRLRSEIREQKFEEDEELPVVYGLGTVYSSTISIFLACFALPLAMLLGDGLAPSVTMMLVHICGFLELYSSVTLKEPVEEEIISSLLYPVTTWFLMSSHYFFTSGHQATIPSIRFEAAFVGLPGDMKNIHLPGFLIMLNTFASEIMFAISLPLILFWSKKFSLGKITSDTSDGNKGEFVYAENPNRLHTELFRVCALYQFCKGFKLLGTMLAAAIHRRHLMVWKIFAPRFIFEGVSFIVTSVMLMLAFWFVLRVDNALRNWCAVLERDHRNKGGVN